jgi:hypothetical protein
MSDNRWGQLMRRAAQGLRAAGDEDPFAAQGPGSQASDLDGQEPESHGSEDSDEQGPEPDPVRDQDGAGMAGPGAPLPQRDPDHTTALHRHVPPAQRPDDNVLDRVAKTLRRL